MRKDGSAVCRPVFFVWVDLFLVDLVGVLFDEGAQLHDVLQGRIVGGGVRILGVLDQLLHELDGNPVFDAVGVGVLPERGGGVAVSHAAGDAYGVLAAGEQQRGVGVPLRYNYDKPEKPRISRVFGYQARFFILFQPEKSSREVVIS